MKKMYLGEGEELIEAIDNEKERILKKYGVKVTRAELIRKALRNIIEEYLTQKDEPVDVTQNVAEEILPEKTITEKPNIAENPNIPAEIIAKARESFVTDNKYEPESDEDLKEYIEFYMKLDNGKKIE